MRERNNVWVGQLRGRRLRGWSVLYSLGLVPLLTSCGAGAEADDAEPTAAESRHSSEEAAPEPSHEDEPETQAGQDDDESDEDEPIPASSEGPAQNWPEPEIPEEIYEPTEEGAEALI